MKQSEIQKGHSYSGKQGDIRTVTGRMNNDIYYVHGFLSPYPKQLICFCHQYTFARWAKKEVTE